MKYNLARYLAKGFKDRLNNTKHKYLYRGKPREAYLKGWEHANR